MSNKLVNMVDQARVGDATAKSVLRKIADQSNDYGEGVWSSHKYIGWCLEVGRDTVSKKMGWLKDELGVISWETRPGTSNLYTVNVDRLKELAGVGVDDTQDEGCRPSPQGVSVSPTPDVGTDHTSLLINPTEPSTIVTDTAGTPVDEHLVCEHCKSAPKKNKRKSTKYCLECSELGNCSRCGEHKVERWPKKRRELCSECGLHVDGLFTMWAYKTFQKRSNHRLDWQQVEQMVKVVGNKENMLYAWGKWLDYWKASGWFMGKNAIGKILKGFEDNLDEYLTDKVPAGTIGKNDPNRFLPPPPKE